METEGERREVRGGFEREARTKQGQERYRSWLEDLNKSMQMGTRQSIYPVSQFHLGYIGDAGEFSLFLLHILCI